MRTVAGASATTASARRTQRQERRRVLERGIDAAVDLADQPERDRRHQHDDHEDHLEDAVEAQRRADPVGDAAADRGADGHPAEEAGQDRRHRLGRVAEDQDELARPDDLVHEPGRARQDEDREDRGDGRSRASPGPGRGGHRLLYAQ